MFINFYYYHIEKVSRIVFDNNSVDLPGFEKRERKNPLQSLNEDQKEDKLIRRHNFKYITYTIGGEATKVKYFSTKGI